MTFSKLLLLLLVAAAAFTSVQSRLAIVPGKGCGATKPMRPLNSDDIDGMVSTSDVECGTVRAEDGSAVKKLKEKVGDLKCKEDSGACRNAKDSIFITGGADCSAVAVTIIKSEEDLPSDILTMQCTLLDEKLANTIRAGNQALQVKWCLEEKLKCSSVEGHVMLKAPRSLCGLSVAATYVPTAPPSWVDKGCVLVPEALYAQERESIEFQWCLEGRHDCTKISGHTFMEVPGSEGCQRTIATTFVDQAPGSWRGTNCVLLPDSLYSQEESNIRIAWCMDNENTCSHLPAGYGYESGDGCGSTAATEVVDSAPLHLPADFECKIMTPAVFLSLTKDLAVKHCAAAGTCHSLASSPAGDRADWTAYTEFLHHNSVSWGPQLAIDGTTAYYHSRNGASEASGYGDYLQIDLAALYFVTSITYTTRNNCACAEWYNRYVEARVGTVDASQVHTSPALLTVNEVCSTGNPDYSLSNTYVCPQPLKGQFVTFQRTQENPAVAGWAMYIDEVNVEALA